MARFFRRLLIPMALIAVAIATALLASQFRAVRTILVIFPRWVIALIVGLILLDEVVKIARWHFFVRAAGIPIRWQDSATSMLAAQTASILHGGDVFRIRLAAEHGVLPRTGVTISFAMWATDMMTLPLLALAGFGKHLVARWALFLPLVIPLMLLLIIRSHRFAYFVSRALGRFPLTRRYALNEEEIVHATHLLTRRSVVLGGMAYAAVMRLIFAGVLLCITNVINDAPLRYQTVLSAHALSTIAGTVGFLPGVVSIGSLVALLNARGVSHVTGFLISITNRIINVTINLAIGFIVLLVRYRRVVTGAFGRAESSPPRPLAAGTLPSRTASRVNPTLPPLPVADSIAARTMLSTERPLTCPTDSVLE
jgi:lysylphosphatidylglycerol synthase-like protein